MVNTKRLTKRIALAGFSVAASTMVATAHGEMPTVEYEKFTLDNGLRVILSVDKDCSSCRNLCSLSRWLEE